ncbi:hypothetical protein V5N11_003728 [Cardamine amara subsp. amara]|uniref:Uncharacterized protein n=1 Tax=Cardamine amara subsp. amara TaxID=228776 RepID=A0ABD1AHI3_CARAN
MLHEQDNFVTVEKKVRDKYQIRLEEEVVLTYQWPEWMLDHQWKQTPPIDVVDDREIELFLALRMDIDDLLLCVTVGNDVVERYHLENEFDSGKETDSTN